MSERQENEMQKCALITGAVRNSGLGIAGKFLSEGIPTFITSRKAEDAEQIAKELTEKFQVPCYGLAFSPLHAKEETEALFAKVLEKGFYVDSLICNAADLGRFMDPLTVEASRWEEVLLTNVMGYFVPARTAAKQMMEYGDPHTGTIVFVGSINYKDALPERSAYVTSKGAIRSMTKALAIDFGPYGIRVNCIAPGPIWTTRYEEYNFEETEKRRNLVPLKTITTKEQMGNIAYFLSTDMSQNMTGSVVVVDGGMDCMVAGGY